MLRSIAAPAGFARRGDGADRLRAGRGGWRPRRPVRRAGGAAGPPPRPGAPADRRASEHGGATHGARFAYLQVVATNAAALPLYAEQVSAPFETSLSATPEPRALNSAAPGGTQNMSNYVWEKSYPPGVKWELEVPKKTHPPDLRGELRAIRRPAVHRLPRQGHDLPRLQGSVGPGGRRLPEARRQNRASMSASTCPTRRTTSSPSSACSRPAAGWSTTARSMPRASSSSRSAIRRPTSW